MCSDSAGPPINVFNELRWFLLDSVAIRFWMLDVRLWRPEPPRPLRRSVACLIIEILGSFAKSRRIHPYADPFRIATSTLPHDANSFAHRAFANPCESVAYKDFGSLHVLRFGRGVRAFRRFAETTASYIGRPAQIEILRRVAARPARAGRRNSVLGTKRAWQRGR
jgi:hypothetical protein